MKNRGFSLDRPNRATCLLFVLFYLFTGLHNALQLLSSKLPTTSILTTLETRNTLSRSHTLRGTGHSPGSRLTLTLQQKTPAESLTEKLKYLTSSPSLKLLLLAAMHNHHSSSHSSMFPRHAEATSPSTYHRRCPSLLVGRCPHGSSTT